MEHHIHIHTGSPEFETRALRFMERMEIQMSQLQDAIATLKADDASLKDQLTALAARDAALAQKLKDAIDALAAGGASADDLADLNTLHTDLQADISTVQSEAAQA